MLSWVTYIISRKDGNFRWIKLKKVEYDMFNIEGYKRLESKVKQNDE